MRRRAILLMGSLALLSSCAGTMAVVGFDAEGKNIEEKLEHDKYVNEVTASLVKVNNSVVPALDRQEQQDKWDMNTVIIGLAFQPQGGIGGYAIGGNAGIRLYFDRVPGN